MNEGTEMITVCDACLRACCWQGIFMCDESRYAGIVQKSRAELETMGLEHSDYWNEASAENTKLQENTNVL